MTNYSYSVEHVHALRVFAFAHGFSAPPGFWRASDEELQAVYNGIGPDRWSTKFRGWVTRALDRFEFAALPHDWEYTYSPKTYWAFTTANARFATNCWIEGWATKRWSVIPLGFLLAIVCQLFGWSGYATAAPPDSVDGPETDSDA